MSNELQQAVETTFASLLAAKRVLDKARIESEKAHIRSEQALAASKLSYLDAMEAYHAACEKAGTQPELIPPPTHPMQFGRGND